MAVGLPTNKWDVDGRAGGIVLSLRDALRQVVAFNDYLNTMDDEELGTEGVGYSPEDIELLRASFIDLLKLTKIAHGQEAQPEPNNFFWNAGKLTGPQ